MANLESFASNIMLYIPVFLFFGIPLLGVILSPAEPLSFIKKLLRSRGLPAFFCIIILILCFAAFSTWKQELTYYVGFFAETR